MKIRNYIEYLGHAVFLQNGELWGYAIVENVPDFENPIHFDRFSMQMDCVGTDELPPQSDLDLIKQLLGA